MLYSSSSKSMNWEPRYTSLPSIRSNTVGPEKRELTRQLRHFVKHDVADAAIWSLDVEKAQAVIRY